MANYAKWDSRSRCGNALDFVLRGRATKEDWNQIKERIDYAKDYAKQDGADHMAEHLEKRTLTIPLESRQWIDAAKGWKHLTASSFSNQSLEVWMNKRETGSSS